MPGHDQVAITGTARDFDAWLEEGWARGWISDTFCSTHDMGAAFMPDEDRADLEAGQDPCLTVVALLAGDYR